MSADPGAATAATAADAAAGSAVALAKTVRRSDTVAAIVDRVRAAHAAGTALRIRGGGTKTFYGEAEPDGDFEWLDTRGLDAPAEHEPSELVVTAAAGMRLADLEAQLAEHGQCLAFEPPRFSVGGIGSFSGDGGTVGGMVAAGLSGPRRVAAGSLRDHLLGASVVDGTGALLHFGGKVIKNVAGYDVSRVMAGALGILGVVVEVSLKVLPRPESTTTLRFDLAPAAALAQLHAWGARPLPIDASACWNGDLVVRLSGSAAAVDEARARLGGDRVEAAPAESFWRGLRDHADPFFVAAAEAVAERGATLWRLALPQTAPPLDLGDDDAGELVEWHGAQRWLVSSRPAAEVRAAAVAGGGHATMFRALDKSAGTFTPPSPPLLAIHQRLKRSFDPKGILNRGRLVPGL